MKTKDCYTELAIQIATVDMKLDKILELLNQPNEVVNITGDATVTGNLESTANYDLTKPYGFTHEIIK